MWRTSILVFSRCHSKDFWNDETAERSWSKNFIVGKNSGRLWIEDWFGLLYLYSISVTLSARTVLVILMIISRPKGKCGGRLIFVFSMYTCSSLGQFDYNASNENFLKISPFFQKSRLWIFLGAFSLFDFHLLCGGNVKNVRGGQFHLRLQNDEKWKYQIRVSYHIFYEGIFFFKMFLLAYFQSRQSVDRFSAQTRWNFIS